jgi:hypothetical protein
MCSLVLGDNIVTGDHYLHIPDEEFLPFLQRRGVNFSEIFFQQETTWPHIENENVNNRDFSNTFSKWFGYGLDGPGHHTLQIKMHVIIYYEAF